MPSISIRDSLSVELVSASPQDKSGLGKYLRGRLTQLIADPDISAQFRRPLTLVDAGEHGFLLRIAQDVPLAVDADALTLSAGSAVTLGVHRPGTFLYEGAFLGPPLRVSPGVTYVSLAIHPTLAVGVEAKAGRVSFGVDGGTDAEFRCCTPFDTSGTPALLTEACREALETFTIPNTVDDLRSMLVRPVGTVASVSGHGRLLVSCAVEIAATFNPLASVDTVAALGTLTAAGSSSANVGVHAKISGDFQIRVQTVEGGKVRLSFHKMAAREMGVSLDASAGPGITLGDRELLKMLFKGPGGPTDTNEDDLLAAGLSPAQLAKIVAAMKAGISRRLTFELSAALSSLRQDEAAFLYEIDVEHLDPTGVAAVNDALAGNLVTLNRLEGEMPNHGIAILQNGTERVTRRRIQWRVNLVGLVNILSLTELTRTGSVFHDEDSGELIITDKVTSDRLGATTKGRALRKMLFESVMLTATYKAGAIDPNTGLRAAQSFFTMDRHANRQRMADYLDAIVAVGLMPAADLDECLGAVDDFGRSSLLIEADYDQAACERLFMDADQPHDQEFYEDVGKLALLALVQKRDVDGYRRIPLEDGTLWKKMRAASTFSLKPLLPHPITGGDPVREAVRVEVVAADYTLIVWWATAMATAARALGDMRAFMTGPPARAADDTNPDFRKRRDAVSQAMVRAVQKNRTTFGDDPWGLVAMFYASRRKAAISGAVVSPRLTMMLGE